MGKGNPTLKIRARIMIVKKIMFNNNKNFKYK